MKQFFFQCVMGLGAIFFLVLPATGCGKNESPSPDSVSSGMGIGPIKQKITLGALDPVQVAKGQAIFQSKCSACHKFDEKYVGPPLKGVTQRRSPEWILNQILNPTEMTQKDPVAKELLATYMTQMTPQNLTENDAKAVLEYFRQVDSETKNP